ncbi:MAG: TetR family transcriptional regulator, partial [Jatrophihabitans sp.]|nr:TetR family transcriptional regulator [Jatrophihabitans sp.]
AYITERWTEFRELLQTILREGVADATFRADLDVSLAYRFLRDTVWVGVGWYRPGGTMGVDVVAQQYLSIVLDGISTRRRPVKRT